MTDFYHIVLVASPIVVRVWRKKFHEIMMSKESNRDNLHDSLIKSVEQFHGG